MADAQLGCQKCTQFGEVGGFNPPEKDGQHIEQYGKHMENIWKTY
jgi:hypothetical protein